MAEEYDLVILGGGTGGYVAAIRASQLDMRVAVVEKAKLGGTCLHRGCIPSKALLQSAEIFKQTKKAGEFGIDTSGITLDFSKVQDRKNQVVENLYQGVQSLMKKGKIDIYEGLGRIMGPSIFSPMSGTISVEYAHDRENTMLTTQNVLIATGSEPRSLPGLEIDGDYVMTSDEALQMETLPSSIMIIGGGVIGIEWASMLADFDVDVTIIEYLEHILPTEDEAIAKETERQLRTKGVRIVKEAQVLPETLQRNDLLSIDANTNGTKETFTAERMLVSVGRSANISDIGLQNTGITTSHGAISTNDVYQTKDSHIYAIGDVIGGMQLAHAASHEGIVAVEHMAGENPLPLDNNNIPTCIYANPEAASVGLTEQQAHDQGYDVTIGKFPFNAIGKALIHGESEGFVKLVADQKTKDLLGVHMIGPRVTDMISEAGLAKVLDATPWEISQSVHPHPSLSEIMGEAALAVNGRQIHG